MLWYKAWLETRSRFLASLCGATLIVSFFAHHAESLTLPGPRANIYTRNVVFYSHQYLMFVWILCAILLGMGGLIRERAIGASSFTLALPVSRTRLVVVRIAVGLLEAIALGVVPWVAICLIMDSYGKPVLLSQAAFYLGLLISGGLIYFALAVMTASLVENEYTAPAVAYGTTILMIVLCGNIAWLRPYADLWRFMGGDNHLNKGTFFLSGPFPWSGAIAALAVTTVLLATSVWLIQHTEF